jgi:microsomal dipeptidase-like Zn-dependent dipeptidase
MQRAQPLLAALLPALPGEEHAFTRLQQVARQIGPPPPVRWEKIVEHIDRVKRLAGADHVALGSDFDGATMPEGMEDVTALPKITEALLRRGYSEAEVMKVLGENLLRVMAEAERLAEPRASHSAVGLHVSR